MVDEEARILEGLDIRCVGRDLNVEVVLGPSHVRDGGSCRSTHFRPVLEEVSTVARNLLAAVEDTHCWRRN